MSDTPTPSSGEASELAAVLAQARQSVAELEQEKQRISNFSEQLSEQIKVLATQREELKTSIEKINAEHAASKGTVDEASKTLQALGAVRNVIEQDSKTIAEARASFDSLNNDAQASLSQLAILEKEISTKIADIDAAVAEANVHRTELDTVAAEIDRVP